MKQTERVVNGGVERQVFITGQGWDANGSPVEPCDPPNACSTHGRCWTHSDWADEPPRSKVCLDPTKMNGYADQFGGSDY